MFPKSSLRVIKALELFGRRLKRWSVYLQPKNKDKYDNETKYKDRYDYETLFPQILTNAKQARISVMRMQTVPTLRVHTSVPVSQGIKEMGIYVEVNCTHAFF